MLQDKLEWQTVTCSANQLQNAIKDGLSASREILENMLAKGYIVAGHFNTALSRTEELNKQQK